MKYDLWHVARQSTFLYFFLRFSIILLCKKPASDNLADSVSSTRTKPANV